MPVTILRTAEIHSRRLHRERSDQVSGNKCPGLQQRQIARPVQALRRGVLQTFNLPFVALGCQRIQLCSRHRLSSSSSTARVCNQVATDAPLMKFSHGCGLKILLAPSIGSWHPMRQAATFKFKQCGLTIRSTGPIAACRHLGYKSLAQMPARRNGPVSSNVSRRKYTQHRPCSA